MRDCDLRLATTNWWSSVEKKEELLQKSSTLVLLNNITFYTRFSSSGRTALQRLGKASSGK